MVYVVVCCYVMLFVDVGCCLLLCVTGVAGCCLLFVVCYLLYGVC